MRYYKTLSDELITAIGTINADGGGNITEAEYSELLSMIHQMPEGKAIRDNGDGSYSYVDNPNPPDPDPEVDDSEAFEFLFGGAE